MCKSCYQEANSPNINNDKTIEAARLINLLYFHDGCSVGGYGHIVFDDWNIEDGHIDFCISQAKEGAFDFIDKEATDFNIKTLEYFKTLTEDERYSALAIVEKFIN